MKSMQRNTLMFALAMPATLIATQVLQLCGTRALC